MQAHRPKISQHNEIIPVRNEGEGGTRKESEITVPGMRLSEISYFMDQVAYFQEIYSTQ